MSQLIKLDAQVQLYLAFYEWVGTNSH